MLIVKAAAGRCCSWEPTADFYDEINIGPPAACLTPGWASLPRSARPNALVTKFNLRTHEKMSKGFFVALLLSIAREGERKLSTYAKKLAAYRNLNCSRPAGAGTGALCGKLLVQNIPFMGN